MWHVITCHLVFGGVETVNKDSSDPTEQNVRSSNKVSFMETYIFFPVQLKQWHEKNSSVFVREFKAFFMRLRKSVSEAKRNKSRTVSSTRFQ